MITNELIRDLLFLLPTVPGGLLNMAFVRSRFLPGLSRPLDGGLVLRDGKRVFGANKTWKGVVGMVVLTAICTMALNISPAHPGAFGAARHLNELPFEALYGAALGVAYVLFELPNSFIKRRVDIAPGKNATGIKGVFFTIIDQVDSLLGCAIVVSLFTPLPFFRYWQLVLLASAIHYGLNLLLFSIRLKSQPG